MNVRCLHVNTSVIIHLDRIIVHVSLDIPWNMIKKHVKVITNIEITFHELYPYFTENFLLFSFRKIIFVNFEDYFTKYSSLIRESKAERLGEGGAQFFQRGLPNAGIAERVKVFGIL